MRYSVERYGSRDVVVRGLFLDKLPIKRQGATEFTYSRFLVPWLCNFEGWAMFCDEDQVVTADVSELFEYCMDSPFASVYVNKKQPQFEWPSVMVFNCAQCEALTPEYIEDEDNLLFDFDWANQIGDFPDEWNHFVGDASPRSDAKLYHFSRGIPWWRECRGYFEDSIWWDAYNAMIKSVSWVELHRHTKHFRPTMQRYLKREYDLDVS